MVQSTQEMSKHLQTTFKNAVRDFAKSPEVFRVLKSIPAPARQDVRTLYVLDSSFNPPSRAHLLLARNAIQHDDGAGPSRLLLLLATENADKKYKPAANEDRLAMMTLLANEIRQLLEPRSIVIDVGVIKKPFFADKAKSIDEDGLYGSAEQVHLTGFDTIVRIFDTKYYPEDQQLRVLDPFLSKHRLRVTYRLGDKYGTKEEQDAYVDTIADGSREVEGMRKEWRARIDLVNDAEEGIGISSTKARTACVEGRYQDLSKYLGPEVGAYIQQMDLYREPGTEKK